MYGPRECECTQEFWGPRPETKFNIDLIISMLSKFNIDWNHMQQIPIKLRSILLHRNIRGHGELCWGSGRLSASSWNLLKMKSIDPCMFTVVSSSQ